jgi:biotin transport system substrate-specific component
MQTAIQTHLSSVRAREIALTLVGFFLLAACAKIAIPLQPVPITLQTVGVMTIGLTFATRPALYAIALYLAAGLLGAPVFTATSGWATGGYLIGFFAAVVAMTTFRRFYTSTSFLTTLTNCAMGTVIIFSFGIAWLSYFVGFSSAISLGLLPFIIPGAVKALVLCGAIRFLRGSPALR